MRRKGAMKELRRKKCIELEETFSIQNIVNAVNLFSFFGLGDLIHVHTRI